MADLVEKYLQLENGWHVKAGSTEGMFLAYDERIPLHQSAQTRDPLKTCRFANERILGFPLVPWTQHDLTQTTVHGSKEWKIMTAV